jgi:hypothetical protein
MLERSMHFEKSINYIMWKSGHVIASRMSVIISVRKHMVTPLVSLMKVQNGNCSPLTAPEKDFEDFYLIENFAVTKSKETD